MGITIKMRNMLVQEWKDLLYLRTEYFSCNFCEYLRNKVANLCNHPACEHYVQSADK